jgi:hypothetical protein
MKFTVLSSALVALTLSTTVKANSDKPTPDRVAAMATHGFALIECAIYAQDSSRYNDRAKPLFAKGRASLTGFITALQTFNTTEQRLVLNKSPLIVNLSLGGPSPDFMIGRIYAAAEQYVLDKRQTRLKTTNDDGFPIYPSKEAIQADSEAMYRDRNCTLL